ncbi:unnamed protein product [Cuscuta campestris]|uniref:Uncharacterized protein n=1 Tax=Cuscuta campestris TaxID=132261 RepID=A0A484NAY3_9ASTE|nr:unnamed protein product [Cuscuta campestris]
MDHRSSTLPGFEPGNETIFTTLKQPLGNAESSKDESSPLDVTNAPSTGIGTHAPKLESDSVIEYLNQILLEDDENDQSISYDPIALRAAEKSFYEALHQNPSPANQEPVFFNNSSERSSDYRTSESTISGSYDTIPQCNVDPGGSKLSPACIPPGFSFQSLTVSDCSNGSLCCFDSIEKSESNSFLSANSVPNTLSDVNYFALQFNRGKEEGTRFFPTRSQLVLDTGKAKGKKHHHQDDDDDDGRPEEERSSKHSAVCVDAVELSEVFDKVLLCDDNMDSPSGVRKGTQRKGRANGRRHSKKRGDSREVVDLRSLLISCAESIAAVDHRTTKDLLKVIMQNSSPTGNAIQRMAHAFANALEARLNGTGAQLYVAVTRNKEFVSELLKSHLTSWPTMRISIFFANKMIYDVALKGTSLHVIDFGINYGIQWPTLIRDLSQRPGGPPKLRITGIELPQPGFRPAQMVEETGCRLAEYCKRYGVPFEYNAITSNEWETVKVDNLKIKSGEVVVVNCLFRFRHILDERALVSHSPKDAVLNLIRVASPHLYVHATLLGSHSSHFFVSQFRDALCFYSDLFDLFDETIKNHSDIVKFEQQHIVPEIINVVACEGAERVERPETLKECESRIMRAGFKPLPINPELVKELRGKVKAGYHKEFLLDEDGLWILQGWKCRVLCANACWVPVHQTNKL